MISGDNITCIHILLDDRKRKCPRKTLKGLSICIDNVMHMSRQKNNAPNTMTCLTY